MCTIVICDIFMHIFSMLQHDNLVRCFGASTKSPHYFIVTELMQGGSLTSKPLFTHRFRERSRYICKTGEREREGERNKVRQREIQKEKKDP